MLKIAFFHVHGLIKSSGLEIGRDADNGGQTRYVYDLAEFISNHNEVEKIIIIARKISDPKVSDEYMVEVEKINPSFEIHRIPFGGKSYLPKEELWDHLDELIENTITHFKKTGFTPDWMHSHYGDAGYVVSRLSVRLKIPFAHTGHSLGIPKQEKMEKLGMSLDEAEAKFKFSKRIAAENDVLSLSEFVITSTYQEISDWEKYKDFDKAIIQVLPPGTNTDKFLPYYQDVMQNDQIDQEHVQRKYWVGQTIEKFLSNPNKPVILALCRPDRKKNLHKLIETFGTSKQLQALANLIIFAGIRKDINLMPAGEKEVLTEILLLMDKYDLYGKLAIPKKHDIEDEVAYIYGYAATKRGLFVNLALYENFGLTTIEAAATGLPVVATKNGGPSEVLPRCKNGILVDPTNNKEIQEAFLSILTDDTRWRNYSNNGIKNVRKYYSWYAHSDIYVSWLKECLEPKIKNQIHNFNIHKSHYDRIKKTKKLIITDIDGTLIRTENSFPGVDELKQFLEKNRDEVCFGVATGRNFELIEEVLNKIDLDLDVMIASVGSDIYYGRSLEAHDPDWHRYIAFLWDRENIKRKLSKIKWLDLQESENQNTYKLSYYVDPALYNEDDIKEALGTNFYHITLIYSGSKFLDVMPLRASKGNAIRYLGYKWGFSLKNIIASGDSGNDADMFRRPLKGIIVANKSKELYDIPSDRYVYHAEKEAAEGILEGLEHYGF
jgi:sucrose-phosphate synthase